MRAATSWRLASSVLVGLAVALGTGRLASPARATTATWVSAAAVDAAAIDDHVRSMLDAWAVPGGAIAIVRDGAVVHLAAFGEASPGRAMTTATPVAIGSVGKSITALAIRQLVEAGRLGLAWPVTRALPWFRLAGPPGSADRITIGNLLQHTSGLSTADGQDPRRYATGLTPEAVVRGLGEVAPAGPPGEYAYSNLNFVVLGVVIEAVSGESYDTYVRRHVFEPLGMSRSFTDPAGAPAAIDAATGHRYLFGLPVAFDEPYPPAIVAAGYQSSSAEDMARFVAALSNGGVVGQVDVISPGQAREGEGLGTDWQPLGAMNSGSSSGQSGATLATNADILVLPAEHLGVVVVLTANPIQLSGIPGGAAEVASDVMAMTLGHGTTTAPTGVRQVYLVVDAVLLVLFALLVVHAARARSWAARLATTSHPRLLIGRTLLADLVLPIAVLAGLPLAIGATGSSASGDVAGGWRFVLWTLPDLGAALLVLAIVPLILSVLKLRAWAVTPRGRPGRVTGSAPAAGLRPA